MAWGHPGWAVWAGTPPNLQLGLPAALCTHRMSKVEPRKEGFRVSAAVAVV